MEAEPTRAFCQRNLKPVFALLIVLIMATITWAAFFESKQIHGKGLHAAVGAHAAQAAGGSGQTANVDGVTAATAGGGVHVIAQRNMPASTMASPRMQLVAGQMRSRHAFNTISGLILPTVVSIHATRNTDVALAPAAAQGGARFLDPFDGVPEKFVSNKAYETVGSGIVIDSHGFVLTNYHVISQATELLVSVFGDINKDFSARVIAVDPGADLALIQVIGAPTLPEARLGNSQNMQVGDWVLAFGSPFGLDQTVTQGIVSNRREKLVVEGVSYGEMLQTDAPINRGSSGGPLVNLNAEVIGINSAIYGPNGVFSGTGFAIPVNCAKTFIARYSNAFRR